MHSPLKSRAFPFRIVLVIALLALLASAGWYLTRPQAIAVTISPVERGVVEATVANTRAGTVKACRRARLAPSSGGQIARLLVHEGERVDAGQVLLELWNEDLSAQKKLTQQQLKSAQAGTQQACTVAAQFEREAERTRQLKARGFVSDARLDQALSESAARRAACEAARADAGQARERIAVAQAGLDRTRLRAPFAGIVAEVTGELGEFTTPSPPGIPTPPAIDLIDDSCLYVSAPIDEVDAPNVKLDLVGRITLDAMSGRHFAGKVRRIAPYVLDLEKQARTVEVEVQFDDPAAVKALLVGYSADVEIIYTSRPDVLRIPTAALLEGNRVLVIREGVAESRQLKLGLSNWEYSEVTGGLAEGEKIITSLDREGVKAGARVSVETAGAKHSAP
ncbi:MAG: efflux RND transporter periplasmic adaptor subunit [Sulfurimicrobium sp.]|nr:efflux RND transporter periplasmic adaptor subunit [Sulfurimicrobium sp.]MDO9188464.1 efflux RND transporter periplasmic adaptor subunit [Sulfurimicrobium sp.]MDP1705031.1 efflux RND transporter periplasmic adaptor subunit [Sulfurimicrobium sp.]MDP2198468.1 efflux RND transporter periplasmic adaptor subunit [Sulfurimicrobium sp.]MDP3687374.1 efflux RND transporter periplasmic adaptor subunit [Sulfurimicrobium sp.]